MFTTLLLLFAWIGSIAGDNVVRPSLFYSRPDLFAPALNVLLHHDEVEPGYIFVSPYFYAIPRPDPGPYIFETDGSLIWSGIDDSNSARHSDVHGLHVCQHRREDHLCFWKGRQRGIHGSGVGVIMDRHYQVIRTVRANATSAPVDLHEFRLTNDGTALVTGYAPRLHRTGWILDSVFREIDVETGEVMFEWSAMDHVTLSDSLTPSGTYDELGDGRHNHHPWDFFHINSVDKSQAGDYLISSRHTDTIFKVSKNDGSIIWRLGGRQSTFKLLDFTFSRQHHARFLKETANRTVLSLFDNDNDGYTVHGQNSTALIIEIDHELGVANLLTRLAGPTPNGLVTDGMGSFSVHDDGNMLVSWGADSQMAEYSSNGTAIWYANIGWDSRNYRTYKSAWVGEPQYPPDLWTASELSSSPTVSFVSWNGATEVRAWRFYGSENEHGPYQNVGFIAKTGFETRFEHDLHWPWTFAEALDRDGLSLGKSSVRETTVLSLRMVSPLDDCEPSPCMLDGGCRIGEWPK